MAIKTSKPNHWRFQDLTSQKFNRLLVLGYYGRSENTRTSYWSCKCDCENSSVISGSELKTNGTKSCGCLNREKATSHGFYSNPEYYRWRNIKSPCYNPKDPNYKYYGARGIKVCDKWLNDPHAFAKDMGQRPTAKHTIDRIDNNGDYEPQNCRWPQ